MLGSRAFRLTKQRDLSGKKQSAAFTERECRPARSFSTVMYRLSHPMERSIGDIAEGDQIQPIDLHCSTWNFNKKIGKIFGICVERLNVGKLKVVSL
jgi:hypothetical protein